jgi:hypothetical protein
MRILLLLGLAACSGSNGGDTAADTGAAGTPVTFSLDGAWEGTTLTLTWADAAEFFAGQFAFGDVAHSSAASATVTVDLPAPEASALTEVDPTGNPGVKLAWLVPALHTDTDGDGLPSAEEGYAGAGLVWLMYAEGSPAGLPGLGGAVPGWNAVTVNVDARSPAEVGSLTAVPLRAGLELRSDITLSGSFAVDVAEGTRVAMVSRVALEGGAVTNRTVVDVAASSPFSLTVTGAPPEDHFAVLGSGLSGAMEVGLVYVDQDESGGINRADQMLYGLCLEATPVGVIYFSNLPDLDFAVKQTALGNGAGWSGIELGGEGHLLQAGGLASVTAGPDCALSDE